MRPQVIAFIVAFLISGTAASLLTKVAFQLRGVGAGLDHLFHKPLFITLCTFLGEGRSARNCRPAAARARRALWRGAPSPPPASPSHDDERRSRLAAACCALSRPASRLPPPPTDWQKQSTLPHWGRLEPASSLFACPSHDCLQSAAPPRPALPHRSHATRRHEHIPASGLPARRTQKAHAVAVAQVRQPGGRRRPQVIKDGASHYITHTHTAVRAAAPPGGGGRGLPRAPMAATHPAGGTAGPVRRPARPALLRARPPARHPWVPRHPVRRPPARRPGPPPAGPAPPPPTRPHRARPAPPPSPALACLLNH